MKFFELLTRFYHTLSSCVFCSRHEFFLESQEDLQRKHQCEIFSSPNYAVRINLQVDSLLDEYRWKIVVCESAVGEFDHLVFWYWTLQIEVDALEVVFHEDLHQSCRLK
jgi:hypothetical protein